MKRNLRRILRMARKLATDRRVPPFIRPLVVFGLLPLPWILDEMALLTAGLLLIFLRPGLLQILWEESA